VPSLAKAEVGVLLAMHTNEFFVDKIEYYEIWQFIFIPILLSSPLYWGAVLMLCIVLMMELQCPFDSGSLLCHH
jgi:hypothetical protein